MKPTQEQIEAALRYIDGIESHDDKEVLLLSSDELHSFSMASATILAAAYRDAMAENERLNNQIENIELEGAECAEMRDYAD
jgi:hypothetical protein